jgi:hypothetical protein
MKEDKMSKLKSLSLAAVGVVILSSAISVTGLGQAVAKTVDEVVVTNFPLDANGNLKVASQGTTTVTGTVNVANALKIDPSANTVKIDSSTTHPVQVRDVGDGRQPWSILLQTHFNDGNGLFADASYTVPTGHRFDIQTISVNVNLSSGQTAYTAIYTVGGGDGYIPLTDDGFINGFQRFSALQEVRMSATGTFRFSTTQTAQDTGAFANYSAWGYLVPTS